MSCSSQPSTYSEECKAAAVSRLTDKAAAQHVTADILAQAGPGLLPGAVGQHPAGRFEHLHQGSQAGGQLPEQLHLGPLHYRRTAVDCVQQLLRILGLYESLAGDTANSDQCQKAIIFCVFRHF